MSELNVLEVVIDFAPTISIVVISGLLMFLYKFVVENRMDRGSKRSMIRGIGMSFIGLFGVLLAIITLPETYVAPNTRENIIKIGGLILTGVVAFSSTTVIRDAAAGTALQFMGTFKRGDYLETDDTLGRVAEMGLLHTQIQTRDRSLVTYSNSALISQSYKVIPSSGTVLSTTVSLGYNIPRQRIEETLLEAARSSGLEEPFVHVEELGNYAVTYRVAGLLEEVESLLTRRSDFRKRVLDHLHEAGIEIVSPMFQNNRDLQPDTEFIPERSPGATSTEMLTDTSTEQVVFEKALEAKKAEDLDEIMSSLEDKKAELKDSDEDQSGEIERIEKRITMLERKKEQIEEEIANDDE
ncbi:MAG: mechanosensitive ion channel family protein [bacterium]